MSAGRLYEKMKKKFIIEIMLITFRKVIFRVVEGLNEKKVKVISDEQKIESIESEQVI